MASDGDLYALLGVEPNAPTDVIRAAYRRLAREHHPDRQTLTPEQKLEADALMTELNQAWHVLSDPVRRRQYDEVRSVEELLRRASSSSGTRTEATGTNRRQATPEHTGRRAAREPQRLRAAVQAADTGLRWETASLAGFDWALAARSLLARYVTALSAQEVLDPERAKQFVTAARTALSSEKPRATRYVFLLLVERVSGLDRVRAACREFCASDEGKGCSVVLIDAARSRALLCSDPPRDGKLDRLLAELGV